MKYVIEMSTQKSRETCSGQSKLRLDKQVVHSYDGPFPMPKHELDGETPTSPANKRVRFDFVAEKQQEHQLVDLCRIAAQEVAEPAGQTVAWSKHNLLAKIVSSPPAHIAFSLVPLSKKGKQSCPPFSIALPLASDEDAHYLSFSPAGSHLLLAVGAPNRLRLLLYQIASSGCINDWEIAQEWNLPIQQEYPAKVSSLQWLSEDRQVSSFISIPSKVAQARFCRPNSKKTPSPGVNRQAVACFKPADKPLQLSSTPTR